MEVEIYKKIFALEQIAPYYANPNLCGFENGRCSYKTSDGKMCVAGKNMINKNDFDEADSIYGILNKYSQDLVFVKESANILNTNQWQFLQNIHDSIANEREIKHYFDESSLFTLDELKEYALKLKLQL